MVRDKQVLFPHVFLRVILYDMHVYALLLYMFQVCTLIPREQFQGSDFLPMPGRYMGFSTATLTIDMQWYLSAISLETQRTAPALLEGWTCHVTAYQGMA